MITTLTWCKGRLFTAAKRLACYVCYQRINLLKSTFVKVSRLCFISVYHLIICLSVTDNWRVDTLVHCNVPFNTYMYFRAIFSCINTCQADFSTCPSWCIKFLTENNWRKRRENADTAAQQWFYVLSLIR